MVVCGLHHPVIAVPNISMAAGNQSDEDRFSCPQLLRPPGLQITEYETGQEGPGLEEVFTLRSSD